MRGPIFASLLSLGALSPVDGAAVFLPLSEEERPTDFCIFPCEATVEALKPDIYNHSFKETAFRAVVDEVSFIEETAIKVRVQFEPGGGISCQEIGWVGAPTFHGTTAKRTWRPIDLGDVQGQLPGVKSWASLFVQTREEFSFRSIVSQLIGLSPYMEKIPVSETTQIVHSLNAANLKGTVLLDRLQQGGPIQGEIFVRDLMPNTLFYKIGTSTLTLKKRGEDATLEDFEVEKTLQQTKEEEKKTSPEPTDQPLIDLTQREISRKLEDLNTTLNFQAAALLARKNPAVVDTLKAVKSYDTDFLKTVTLEELKDALNYLRHLWHTEYSVTGQGTDTVFTFRFTWQGSEFRFTAPSLYQVSRGPLSVFNELERLSDFFLNQNIDLVTLGIMEAPDVSRC